MATLAVRPLSTRDLPSLRHVRQRIAVLDWDLQREVVGPSVARQAVAALLPNRSREQIYVALIDDELCATLSMRPQSIAYRWDIAALAAGSPRLDAADATVLELWTALLEYGIAASGSAGAKRLFAAAVEESVACRSLRTAGFEPYTRQTMLRASGVSSPAGAPAGMRRQEASDVWSIHQLYHHVTPRPVQFAEAWTSAAWELPRQSPFALLAPDHRPVHQLVLETIDGIGGYCRVTGHHHRARLELLVDPSVRDEVGSFVAAAAEEAGVEGSDLEIVIPQYSSDLIWPLETIGFVTVAERVALVRHTTAPAVVHERFAVAPVEGERVPKGVPSYYRVRAGTHQCASAAVETHATHRMERYRN